jgi:hypothetical protein
MPTIITQAVPRFLTFWFKFTALQMTESSAPQNAYLPLSSSTNAKKPNWTGDTVSMLSHITSALSLIELLFVLLGYTAKLLSRQEEINGLIHKHFKAIAMSTWYTSISQLVSRVGHPNTDTVNSIRKILYQILVAYPKHTVWHIIGLLKSNNTGTYIHSDRNYINLVNM